MSQRFILTLILVVSCLGIACQQNTARLQHTQRPYDDQGHVFLTEFPHDEAHLFVEKELPGGLAMNRHTYDGYYVFENPDSLMHDRAFRGETVILYRPRTPGEKMNPRNIIYQYSLSQGNDKEGNQIWMLGEYVPPADELQWVVAATGRHKGTKAEGVWHWEWPVDPNWPEPPTPEGMSYPNAEEFSQRVPAAVPGPLDPMPPVYWFTEPPFGNGTEGLADARPAAPAKEAPANSRHVAESGHSVIRVLPALRRQQEPIPGGLFVDQFLFTGEYRSDDPDSPFDNRKVAGQSMAILKDPAQGYSPENVICQWVNLQTEDADEDQIWWLGEYFPPHKPKLVLKVATGKFEGLKAEGTWHGVWPAGRKSPELPEGYDLAVAAEYEFELPVK